MVGAGSRFQKEGYTVPKPLIEVAGKTLIEHSIDSFNIPDAKFIFITRDFHKPEHNKLLSNILKKKRPESKEIRLKRITSGATESALAARDLINNNEPLVIYNCDQLINWDSEDFLKFVNNNNINNDINAHQNSSNFNIATLSGPILKKNKHSNTLITS